ncbi:hypothetical protein EGW08_018465 [Elysia chlorotica]|uniref:Uncharacterized protein n=1 Tax=Elysia chlorotica TaxID=188477 RepID=A0A3S1B1D1_ELYCH|nr:hypothetical protein EGW08_018465 [Elysia chlorotica]
MMPDADNEDNKTEIGPTIKDLEKHRKMEKKAKLPATRVGAKFDRSVDQSETWMPSFGGVWHHSRRTDSLKQFNRRHKLQLSKPALMAPDDAPVETFVYPSSVDLYTDAPTIKTPRTTATAPAPWNNHLQSETTYHGQSQPAMVSSNLHTTSHLGEPSTNTLSNKSVRSAGLETELSAAPSSVKPYVSKRRQKNVSSHYDTLSNPDYHATHFSSHNYTYSPLHINSSRTFNSNGPSTTVTSFQNQNQSSYFHTPSQSHSLNTEPNDQYFHTGFTNNIENPAESKCLTSIPSSSSIQGPIRLISTPLLQQREEKR